MIAHVLLFRPRANLSATDRTRLADSLSTALREIPSLRRVRVGRRVTVGRSYEQLMRTDYPLAAILEFDDLDGLKAYLDHPAHADVSRRFFDAVEETLVYDFDLKEGDEATRELL